jgi:Raf kinase inhibitor-like YbhB/YbcL family protein
VKAIAVASLLVLALAGCAGGEGSSGVESGPIVEGFELRGVNSVAEGKPIPEHCTCDGEDAAPALAWTGVPEGTQELALVLEDPDAPGGGAFTHWLVWGIDPAKTSLDETSGVSQGRNDFGGTGYQGPCPPRGQTHHYVFRLLALHKAVELQNTADRASFDYAVGPHVFAEARLTATYGRQ